MLNGFLSFLKSIFRTMSNASQSVSDAQKARNKANAAFANNILIPPPSVERVEIESYMQTVMSSQSMAVSQMLQHRVKKLVHIKFNQAPQHEFIQAIVAIPDGPEVYLSFDRFKGHQLPPGIVDQLDPTSPQSKRPSIFPVSDLISSQSYAASVNSARNSLSSVSSVSESSESLMKSNALDVIRNVTDRRYPSNSVQCIFTPKPPLSLLYLATIAETLHDLAPKYRLYNRQCYWFAMMMMRIAMLQGGTFETSGPSPKRGSEPVPVIKTLSNLIDLGEELAKNADEPAGLDDISIPEPPPEDIKNLEEASLRAGKIGSLPVVTPNKKHIWAVGLESQASYRKHLEALIKAEAKRNEDRNQLADKLAATMREAAQHEEEAKIKAQQLEEANQQLRNRDLEIIELRRKVEALN